MAVVRRLAGTDMDDAARRKLLHEACEDIVALRKGDHSAENLELEGKWLEMAERELELKRESKVDAGLKQIEAEVGKKPAVKAAVQQLREALKEDE